MRRSQYFELEVRINSFKLTYYVEKEYSQHALIIMYVQYPTGHWWRNNICVIVRLYFRFFYLGFPYFWSESLKRKGTAFSTNWDVLAQKYTIKSLKT